MVQGVEVIAWPGDIGHHRGQHTLEGFAALGQYTL